MKPQDLAKRLGEYTKIRCPQAATLIPVRVREDGSFVCSICQRTTRVGRDGHR